jgi:hypothetical protein
MEPESSAYCIYKRPAHVPILSLINLVRCSRGRLLKIHFNSILPLTPRFSKWNLSLRCSYSNLCMHLSFLPYFSHDSPISFSLTWSPGYYAVSLASPTRNESSLVQNEIIPGLFGLFGRDEGVYFRQWLCGLRKLNRETMEVKKRQWK